MSGIKYKAAISDTDILIDLTKADKLSLLDILFDEIIVPQHIYGIEIPNNAGRHYQNPESVNLAYTSSE